ncbi:MAG TPA: phosphate regulon transcriptional regulatory protein PhoB [Gammaproteobacteria bacterium]|nr:phosphate regulon transcriptional regulatory protein PhoB [Gammaproteobacteria bacterium]|tara:strand:+ start:1814 stop:2512 length:699 start_codon:yes stop_codon:yes gene_type:complete
MANIKVLVVDDEFSIRQMIVMSLQSNGYDVVEAEDANSAKAMIVDDRPDLVLLDWMMPGMSGLDFARWLRKNDLTADLPIIMLTAKVEEDYRIQGLEAGVDDYLPKPFSVRELNARMKAVLRRTNPQVAEKNLQADGLVLNPVSKRVTVNGQDVSLGPTEYRLLEFLMTNQDRAYTRSYLLDRVWGGNVYIEDRTVDVHVRRLRKALEAFSCDHLIQTVRGTGYRFSQKTPV